MKVQTDWPEYEPGDTVKLDVLIDAEKGNFDPDEKFYASITVTDTSSFL